MATKRKGRRGDQTKAVAYLRVSTELQELGPDAQRAAIERWADAHGVELVSVHTDLGVSGAAPIDKRPGLLAALDAIAAEGAGVLVVAKRDRIARDVVLAAMVDRLAERTGARVVTADGVGAGEGPEAQLLKGIMDVFAQYERALIRARTRAALEVKRRRGERISGWAPIGARFDDAGARVEAHPLEAAAIAQARALREAGMSLRGIAAQLNAEFADAARGQRWHKTTVVRALARTPKAVA